MKTLSFLAHRLAPGYDPSGAVSVSLAMTNAFSYSRMAVCDPIIRSNIRGGDSVSGEHHDLKARSPYTRAKRKYLSLDRWAQWATVLALPVALLGTLASLAALSGPGPASSNSSVSSISSSSPASPTSYRGNIPSQDLGSWSGPINEGTATFRLIMNIHEGTAGDVVGTFNNPTLDCQGTIQLNGTTSVMLNGAIVPAADVNLDATQNQFNSCVQTVEAYIASASGTRLAYAVITAEGNQGSFENPLAFGYLTH